VVDKTQQCAFDCNSVKS